MVDAIISVVIEVAKCLAPPAVRQLNYLRNYTSNLDNLKTEFENLKGDRDSKQRTVDEAKGNGEVIEMNVENWLESVNKMIREADIFVGEEATANKHCLKGLCPNLKTRYRVSKKAARLKEAIVELRKAGSFDRISYRTAPEDIRLLSNKDCDAFESRKSTLNNVLSALKDPDVNIVGIWGMGGIGKTTLAKEVARQAKNEKLFDKVVFVEVSQSPDIRKIQKEIAEWLDHKFTDQVESQPVRASSLFRCIKQKEKILVILDNIWEKLELRDVGIPHGDDHKGCKILLTARSSEILSNKMDSKQNFSIGILNEEEAWSLFKKMAGDYIEGSQFKSVATDVAKKCAGLPVSIVTVARALRNERSVDEWKDSLKQLRTPSSTNYKDIQPDAYSAIELSYNKLKGEELKKIFLLIGYAHLKSVDELLMCGMGLDLFEDINKMEEAQARVRTLVQKLKASCMLLDHQSEDEECVSMHDVVRDVAVSIASREKNVHVATGELVNGWESSVKSHTSIVLLDVKTNVLPEVLECHQLQLFDIRADDYQSPSLTIPDNFFMRMVQVRDINLSYMHLLSLPSSLGLLTNLRTLRLYNCKLQDISVVGSLKSLEILCLQRSEIKQLPMEVGQLARLRSLDLRDCSNLEVIPQNVLSKLSHLEELYIGWPSFDKWEEEVEGVKNASLDELKHLRNLTTLELYIEDVNILPRGLFFEKLVRYHIQLGTIGYFGGEDNTRKFGLQLNTNICLKDGFIVQLQGIDALCLKELQEQDIKYLVDELFGVGSLQPKYLHLQGSLSESKRWDESTTDKRSSEIVFEDNAFFTDKVSLQKLKTFRLYYVNVERIWQNRLATMSYGIQNLTRLEVVGCRNLRYIFPSSTISSFDRLQHLEIRECPKLEEITAVDQEEQKNVMFSQLEFLEMEDLEKFKCFCKGDVHIQFPSLISFKIKKCPEFISDLTKTVSLQKLETLELYYVDVERIWQNRLATMSYGIQNLTRLEVGGCRNLRYIFPSSTVSSFDRLQHLEIRECPKLEEIIAVDQEEQKNVMFPQLEFLEMKDLEKLKCFYKGDVHIQFPSLISFTIMKCPEFIIELTKMKWDESTTDKRSSEIIFEENAFFTDKVSLQKLKTFQLYYVNVERIWQNRLATMSYGIQNLTSLEVVGCKNLRYIFPSSIVSSFNRLQHLEIRECPKLEEITAVDQEEQKNVMFSQLEFLEMEDLEKFKCFCKGDVHIQFPSLISFKIKKCPEFIIDLTKTFPEDFRKLKCLDVTLDESTTISSLDNFLPRFHSIKKLVIIGDDGRFYFSALNKNGLKAIVREVNKFCDLKYIWKHGTIIENLEALDIRKLERDNLMNLVPSWTTFQNLTTLEVRGCNGLRNVLTTSTTKNLVQLRKMSIQYCNLITEIVADDQGDATKDEIIFSELKMLELVYLSSLTSFCSGNCAFKFPSLESLAVQHCRQMKIFSGGELSTPNLHKVQRDKFEESNWIWKGDLNTTIQQLYIETKEEDKEENDKSITDSDSEAEGSENQAFKPLSIIWKGLIF